MKIRKILALTLALVQAFSALSVVAFASSGDEYDSITLDKTAITLVAGYSFMLTETVHDKNLGNVTANVVWSSSDETVATVSEDGTVKAIKSGTATISAIPDGYEENNTNGKTPLKATCTVNVVDAVLDTDTKSTKDIDQKYDSTVTKNYTDVTKVQVSWTVPDITVTVTQNKKWNTEKLTWDTISTTDSSTGVTAEFDFVNFTSIKVKATVSFTPESAFANASGKTDKYTESYKVDDAASDKAETVINSIIIDREKAPETIGTTAPTAKIEYTITPQSGLFTALTATGSGKFGTYTVTIAKSSYYSITPTFVHSSAYTGTDQNPFVNPVSIEAGADSTATLKFKANTNSEFLGDPTKEADLADIKEEIGLEGAEFVSWSVNGNIATLTIQNPSDDVTFTVPGKRTINQYIWRSINSGVEINETNAADYPIPTYDIIAFKKLTSSDTEESIKENFDASPAVVVTKDEDGQIDYVLGNINGKSAIYFYDEDKTYSTAYNDSLFYGLTVHTSYIDFGNFSTKYVTNMYNWFAGCECSVLDLSGFDTSRVTCMTWMFLGCKNLKMVDLSSFDMSNIKDYQTYKVGGFNEMFKDCYFITAIFAKANADWFVETGFKGTSYNAQTDNSMFAFHNDCGGDTIAYGTRMVGIPNYTGYSESNIESQYTLNLTYANTTANGYLTSLTLNHVKMDLSASSVTLLNQWGEEFDEWNRPNENACIPSSITIKFVPDDGYALPETLSDGITGVVDGTWTVDTNGVGTLSCKDITADFAINLTATAK